MSNHNQPTPPAIDGITGIPATQRAECTCDHCQLNNNIDSLTKDLSQPEKQIPVKEHDKEHDHDQQMVAVYQQAA